MSVLKHHSGHRVAQTMLGFTLGAVVMGLAGTTRAAIIDWQTPTDVTSASSVINTGTTVEAIDASNTTGTRTVNGVTFTRQETVLSPSTKNPGGGTVFFSGDTGDATLNALLNDADINNTGGVSGSSTLSLTGLTSGQQYLVQLFMVDDRYGNVQNAGGLDPRLVSVDGSPDINYTRTAATSLVGTFTADAATQTVTIASTAAGASGPSYVVMVNAYQVRTIPEPASGVLLLLGCGALLMLPRRRRKCASSH